MLRGASSSCATWARTRALEIEPENGADLRQAFEEAYFKLFSYRPSERGHRGGVPPGGGPQPPPGGRAARARRAASHPAMGARSQPCFLDGEWREVPRFEIGELEAGARVDGPALIQQEHSALVVPSRWYARIEGERWCRA